MEMKGEGGKKPKGIRKRGTCRENGKEKLKG